jgi:hypothetical protein
MVALTMNAVIVPGDCIAEAGCCTRDQPLTPQEARKPRPGDVVLCDPCAAYAALGEALQAFRRAAA